MKYKIYTDKSEQFKANVKLTNGNVDNINCRLSLTTENISLILEGQLRDGVINVDIPKIGKFYEEGQEGTIKLEVIADGSYLVPWEETFEVEQYLKVDIGEANIETNSKQDNHESMIQVENVQISKQKKPAKKPQIAKENNFDRTEFLKSKYKNKDFKLTTEEIKKHNINGKDKRLIVAALKRLNK